MHVDRRAFFGATAAALTLPQLARAAGWWQSAPAFPPVDARSVWLVGDSAPPDPVAISARLTELAGSGSVRDGYLNGGAVEALEKAFAAHLGKEACAFFPTGTLANNVALRVLCGDAPHALCQQDSHLYRDESNMAQRMAGINLVPLGAGRVTPTQEELVAAFDAAEKGPYALKVGAISLESPVRRLEGGLIPSQRIAEIAALAAAHGTRMHLDAARLLLAPPSLDRKAYVAPFETVYVSLYKYLGAPFGAVLAGPAATIARAREWRHLYGGLIYQGWAPALLALDGLQHFPERIAKAHGVAETLFAALEHSGKVKRVANPDASNIYRLEMPQALAEAAFERGRAAGVRIGRWEKGSIPFFVNETLLRRPVEDYVKLFLG
ncbi:threonine aldolase [Sphingomonas kyeonggiensis]|uniref:Threonine aldolase n=1 Tax=Sphingomonas kyeonggiensis TaxID=1268553 RepID=A0A7W7K1K6_9SPHN|nr:beta-eliminating lyase-related protein [Sphingomonas kyeonggiensis]MBB4839023.1 threonine aldolase [Sphingomonas kyeonggiensis]